VSPGASGAFYDLGMDSEIITIRTGARPVVTDITDRVATLALGAWWSICLVAPNGDNSTRQVRLSFLAG
jgi:hypothetical protein